MDLAREKIRQARSKLSACAIDPTFFRRFQEHGVTQLDVPRKNTPEGIQ
jgi:hypothetical protein